MSKTAQPQWHMLDFFSDDEGSSALTIFLNNTRLHILADATKLQTKVCEEYHDLIRLLQQAQSDEQVEQVPAKEKDSRSDSGVDVDESKGDNEQHDEIELEERLHQWMAAPVLKAHQKPASNGDQTSQTIQEWYNCPTYFYDLNATEDEKSIQAVELEASSDLEDRMTNLLPEAVLPKYITDKAETPCYNASEFTVLKASDQPTGTPYHPCRVQHDKTKEVHFLKIVDNKQPQATKREIDILQKIHDLKLDKEFNVPSLNGLVAFNNVSKTARGQLKVMGFLLTDIRDPLPLTEKLRSDISQTKREKWAKEVQRVKDLLHEHNIIWGDAKADNFILDADENLYVIDFGGGYTEGWVDKSLIETEEGDNLGTRKIVNALKDPEANVQYEEDLSDDGEEPGQEDQLNKEEQSDKENQPGEEDSNKQQSGKRKREDDSDENARESKVARG